MSEHEWNVLCDMIGFEGSTSSGKVKVLGHPELMIGIYTIPEDTTDNPILRYWWGDIDILSDFDRTILRDLRNQQLEQVTDD
jgi:hypothetical protein